MSVEVEARLEVVEVRPGDLIVIRFVDERVDEEQVRALLDRVKEKFPDNGCIALVGEADLAVMRPV